MKTKKRYLFLTFLLGLLLSPSLSAQENENQIKDIRNARWGMGQPELLARETKVDRYNKPTIDNNMVTYENQDLGKGYRADISYKFLAGRLLKIEYKVWYQSENIVGSCKNIVPFRDKVSYSEHIFKELEESLELKCASGWYFNDSINLRDYTARVDDDYNCTRDGKVLVRLMEIANKYQYHIIHLKMANSRTKAHFKYNEWQNNKDAFLAELGYTPKCEDKIYNTYFWIEFEPNASLKEGISNTAMSIEDLEGKPEEEELIEKPIKEKKSRKDKKKEKEKKEDLLTPAEVITTLPDGAVLPDTLEEEVDKKSKRKSKKEKKKKEDKDDKK